MESSCSLHTTSGSISGSLHHRSPPIPRSSPKLCSPERRSADLPSLESPPAALFSRKKDFSPSRRRSPVWEPEPVHTSVNKDLSPSTPVRQSAPVYMHVEPRPPIVTTPRKPVSFPVSPSVSPHNPAFTPFEHHAPINTLVRQNAPVNAPKLQRSFTPNRQVPPVRSTVTPLASVRPCPPRGAPFPTQRSPSAQQYRGGSNSRPHPRRPVNSHPRGTRSVTNESGPWPSPENGWSERGTFFFKLEDQSELRNNICAGLRFIEFSVYLDEKIVKQNHEY